METGGDDDLLLLHALRDDDDAGVDATTLELLSLIADGSSSSTGGFGAAVVPVTAASAQAGRDAQQADDPMLLLSDDTLIHLKLSSGDDVDDAAAVDLIPLSDMNALSFLDHDDATTTVNSANDGTPTSSPTNLHTAERSNVAARTAAATTHAAVVRDVKPPPVPILPRTVAPIPKETSVNSAHRKQAKDELEYLRQQVQVLEQRLNDLKQQSRGSSPAFAVCEGQQLQVVPPGDRAINITESSTSGGPSDQQQLWERIAKRQRNEKCKAEIKNLKLKQMLETQLKIAQSLSRVLRKRPDVSASSWLDPHHQFGVKKLRIETLTENESVFEMLSERVETLFDQLDGVMRDSGLTDQKTNLQDGIVKSGELDRVFLEVVDCKIVPFDVHTTAAALWKILSSSLMALSNGVYQAIGATENTLRAQFTVTVRLRRSEAQVHVQLVCKRIIEASRVVFVWCSSGESKGSLFEKNRLRLCESAWTVIEEVSMPGAPNTTQYRTPLHTILKSVMRMSPEMENDSFESSRQIDVFTDVVLSGYHQNLAMLHQNVENLVMSELRATR